MDLNRKYFEHQLALMLASVAGSEDQRAALQARADAIGCRILQFQREVGAAAAHTWDVICQSGTSQGAKA